MKLLKKLLYIFLGFVVAGSLFFVHKAGYDKMILPVLNESFDSSETETKKIPEGGYYDATAEMRQIRGYMRRGMYLQAINDCDNTMSWHELSDEDTERISNIKNEAQKRYDDMQSGNGEYYDATNEVSKIMSYIAGSMYIEAMDYCTDVLDKFYLSPDDVRAVNELYLSARNKYEAYRPLGETLPLFYEEELPPSPPEEAEGLSDLKGSIQEYVSHRSGSWGVYIKRLDTNEYLSVNEQSYSPASLIKLYIMTAVFNSIADGSIECNEAIKDDLRLMICESSNVACNKLTKTVGNGNTISGFNKENEITKSVGCTKTIHGSELIDDTGRKVTFVQRNQSSPRDCGIILEKIYRGQLVSRSASAEMMSLLLGQTHTWKIPASLPEGVEVANKTGETDTAECDCAIVFSQGTDYIICVLGNGNVGSGIETIQHISRMTYDYFNKN